MWDQVGQLYAHHGDVPAEVRLLKLTEEVGEVADAFIGMHGWNSRKGVCRTRDDLLDELADVIITAAVAMSGITGDVDEARSHFERRLAAVTERAGSDMRTARASSLPGDDRLSSRVGGVDVVDGGALGDAEDADQVDRVGGVPGLVQDAVLSQPHRVDAERLEHVPDHGGADRAGIGCGLLADQQVRVAL
jgi:NTP pyrophosphatase (non-canonical NTP hydrolase)